MELGEKDIEDDHDNELMDGTFMRSKGTRENLRGLVSFWLLVLLLVLLGSSTG